MERQPRLSRWDQGNQEMLKRVREGDTMTEGERERGGYHYTDDFDGGRV